jgi:hypothetical protein
MRRAAILAMLLLAACGESEPACTNTVIRETPSPGGQLKAVLFHRTCGGVTGAASQVSILAANETETSKGNAFIADTGAGGVTAAWGGPDVEVTWTGPNALTLSYDFRTRVIGGEPVVRGVTITHMGQAPSSP